jgi:hypothetical protein
MHRRESCEEMLSLMAGRTPSEALATGSPRMRIANIEGDTPPTHYAAGIFFPPGQKPYVLVIVTGGFAQAGDAARMEGDLARLVAESLTEQRIAVPLR